MRSSRILIALVACTSLIVAGCSGSGGSPSTGSNPEGSGDTTAKGSGQEQYADGGTFTLAVANDPGNLDPLMTVLAVTRLVDHLAYDTLIYQAPNGKFVSGLAKSWKVQGKKAVFTLTKGVTCSDGSKLTPEVVAENINFVANPKNQSPLLGTVIPAGIKASADNNAGTVTVTTPKPNAFLLNDMASMFIVCEAGMKDRSKLAHDTLGTGPWVLSEAAPDDHYTFTKRKDYTWGPDGADMKGPGVPDTLTVRVISNPTTMTNLMLSGEVNYAPVTGSDRKRLENADGVSTIKRRAPLGETFFNEASGRPGADLAVRKALTMATNIPQVMKVATAGYGAPSKGLVTLKPKPCPGNTVKGMLPDYDPDQARQILEKNGWHLGSDDVRSKDGTKLALTFIYPAGRGKAVAAGAELLAKQWQDVGAQVKLQSVTSTQLNRRLFSTGNWDAGWTPVTVSLPSQLVAFLSGPAPPKGTNLAHLENTGYAKHTKLAMGSPRDAACHHWHAAEKALFKNFDVVPMFDSVIPVFLKNAEVTVVSGELHGASLRLLAG